jgi:hypothetical protein
LSLAEIPYALEMLEIYTLVNIRKNVEQLDDKLRTLNVEEKLKPPILKEILSKVKIKIGTYPAVSDLFANIKEILRDRDELSKIIDENTFQKLMLEEGGKEGALDVLAWGIIKLYIKKEKCFTQPRLYIAYR